MVREVLLFVLPWVAMAQCAGEACRVDGDGYVSDSEACEDGGPCNAVHSNSLLQTVHTRERDMRSKAGPQSVTALEDGAPEAHTSGAVNKLNAVFYEAQSERLAKGSEYFEQYRRAIIVQVEAQNDSQMKVLKDIQHNTATIGLEDWEVVEASGRQVFIFPMEWAGEFTNKAGGGGLKYNVSATNFKQVLEDEHTANIKAFNPSAPSDIVGRVPSLKELYRWLEIMNETYPEADLFEYGNSSQNRSLKGMKISRREGLPIVLVTCAMHGREWITMPACVYWINALLKNKTDQWLMDEVEWRFLPMYNPDGYVKTHKIDRMWRKNVRNKTKQLCGGDTGGYLYSHNLHEHYGWSSFAEGVDLNRNFDTEFWGEPGFNEDDPCHETYLGPEPFSEPENVHFRDFVKDLQDKHRVLVYHDIHAIGQMWIVPPGEVPQGYTETAEDQHLQAIAQEAAKRTTAVNGIPYTSGSPVSLGLTFGNKRGAGGSSFDWVRKGAGVKYVFASELRPKQPSQEEREAGTAPDPVKLLTVTPEVIVPSALEYWEGIKYTVEVALRETSPCPATCAADIFAKKCREQGCGHIGPNGETCPGNCAQERFERMCRHYECDMSKVAPEAKNGQSACHDSCVAEILRDQCLQYGCGHKYQNHSCPLDCAKRYYEKQCLEEKCDGSKVAYLGGKPCHSGCAVQLKQILCLEKGCDYAQTGLGNA